MRSCLLTVALVTACGGSSPPSTPLPSPEPGDVPAPVATPIADQYRAVAATIIDAALDDEGAWNKLAFLTDRIGARLSGSSNLERAVEWAADTMKADGHDVHVDPVMVPHWERGVESASIVVPAQQPLIVLGLGLSVGTEAGGITGDVIVIKDWEELADIGERARGKIVLFDTPMPAYNRNEGTGYGIVSSFRIAGPSEAAKVGAIGVLMRSVTATSLSTPHTGTLWYDESAPKIPAMAVTTEGADMIARFVAAGEIVQVHMESSSRMLPDAPSGNVIGELRGSELPDEVVVIGAHLDSWDVGTGAHDDGAGCALMMQALTVLRRLDLVPRRTIRVVLYTNEENGGRGHADYDERYAAGIPDNHVMAMESDSGAFKWRGFDVQGTEQALAQTQDIITLLSALGAAEARMGFGGVDIDGLANAGVSSLGVWVEEDTYFDIHHTNADTLDKVDRTHLRENLAAITVMAYVIADMPGRFGSE